MGITALTMKLKNPDEARAAVVDLASRGADVIKTRFLERRGRRHRIHGPRSIWQKLGPIVEEAHAAA